MTKFENFISSNINCDNNCEFDYNKISFMRKKTKLWLFVLKCTHFFKFEFLRTLANRSELRFLSHKFFHHLNEFKRIRTKFYTVTFGIIADFIGISKNPKTSVEIPKKIWKFKIRFSLVPLVCVRFDSFELDLIHIRNTKNKTFF